MLRIYISVLLYQETEVLAKVMNRDVITKGDDGFALLIDPYNDNRSGYGFWSNPLGTQTDFRINDDGRSVDANWDTEWQLQHPVCMTGVGPGNGHSVQESPIQARIAIPGESILAG